MVRYAFVALACALGACHDFAPIVADGRCGNGIAEPEADEDCDGFARFEGGACGAPATAGACRYVCEDAMCPDGWMCGLDGICRASAGTLASPNVVAIAGNQLLTGDADADGREDILMLSSTTLTVGYGDDEGHFASRTAVPIAAADGVVSTADLDGDGAIDVVLPSVLGVHLFRGSAARRVVPVAIPFDAAPTSEDPVRVFAVATTTTAAGDDLLLAVSTSDVLDLTVQGRATNAAALVAELGPGGALLPHLGVLDVVDAGPSSEEIAVGRLGGDRITVATVSCPPAPASCVITPRDTVAIPDGSALAAGGTWFEDFDGDGRDDLFATIGVPTNFTIIVALRGADDRFGAFVPRPELRDAANCVRCFAALLQAPGLKDVVDLDGDGVADYVNRGGLYLTRPGSPPRIERVAQPGRPWTDMAVSDLNRDGMLDVAATRPGAIDIVLASSPGRYNILSAPTDAAPSRIKTGDFDGDLLPDLAFVEDGTRVAVLFSGRQGVPTERVVMAELGAVAELEVARIGDDDIDDLVVTVPQADGPDLLVRLIGDSSRRMASVIERRAPIISSAVAGRFGAPGPLELLVAIPKRLPQGGTPGVGPPRVFRQITWQGELGASRIADVELAYDEGCDLERGGFLATTTADLDGDGVDALLVQQLWGPDLGTFREERPYSFFTYVPADGTLTCEAAKSFTTFVAPIDLKTADLDGDGLLDVLMTLDLDGRAAEVGTPDDVGSGVVVLWGSPDGLGEPVIYDARAAFATRLRTGLVQLDADAAMEVALAGDDAIGVFEFDAARRMTERVLASPVGEPEAIAGVDADGDGLEDLAVTTGAELFVYRLQACGARAAARGVCERGEP